jgi:hypothetical protein
VAPLSTPRAETAVRIDARHAVALYPFIDGTRLAGELRSSRMSGWLSSGCSPASTT